LQSYQNLAVGNKKKLSLPFCKIDAAAQVYNKPGDINYSEFIN
jgi:hypothetical protein